MLMLGRMLTMAMALLGGVFFSQAPEFAQQYRQRIGGALDELKIMISEFDAQPTTTASTARRHSTSIRPRRRPSCAIRAKRCGGPFRVTRCSPSNRKS